MIPDHLLQQLLALLRHTYPDWQTFDHPPFIADEIEYKRASAAKAQELLNQPTLDQLIAANDYDEILGRLQKIANDNNLLWRSVPSAGDTAVFQHPNLDPATFSTQIRNLLYGDRPTPGRLQSFIEYATANDLPIRWPFATYYLFLLHPQTDIFIKPESARWFLKFLGDPEPLPTIPTGRAYQRYLDHAHHLLNTLQPYGAADLIDIQSFLWVCHRAAKRQTSGLTGKNQVELDVPPAEPDLPPTTYQPTATAATLRESNQPDQGDQSPTAAPLTLEDCVEQSGYAKEHWQNWLAALQRKKQIIFYGPPGTGKTYLARLLARYLSENGRGFHELIQFHPAYTYEEFIQGLRPQAAPDGTLTFRLLPGRFLQFTQRAALTADPCVLIIDEINRANLAAVLGELMYLLEYRADHANGHLAAIPLAAGGTLTIPPNVYLIGTMNTADRSIALVDHALRRRFAFIHLTPNYDALRHYLIRTNQLHPGNPAEEQRLQTLTTLLGRINDHINNPNYALGPSYFMQPNLAANLPHIWQYEIEPYLEEHFFDQPTQIAPYRWTKIRQQFPSAS